MLESSITKIWRFIKRIKNKTGVNNNLFTTSFLIKVFLNPAIYILAKKKKMLISDNENWGTKLRYLLGWYEPETVMICKKIIQPGMKVLDIGGDVGYFSRIFSELVKEKGIV